MIKVIAGPESRRYAPPMNTSDIRMLARAVSAFESWRGSLVGDPDPGALEKFDKDLIKMQRALRRVKALTKWVDDCEFPRAPK